MSKARVVKTLIQNENDSWSCGPIALSNAIRLLGVKPPNKEKLIKLCKTTKPPNKGTWTKNLVSAARGLGFRMKRTYDIRQIMGPGVFILNYQTRGGGMHFVTLCDGVCFNYSNGKKFILKTRRYYLAFRKCYKVTVKR